MYLFRFYFLSKQFQYFPAKDKKKENRQRRRRRMKMNSMLLQFRNICMGFKFATSNVCVCVCVYSTANKWKKFENMVHWYIFGITWNNIYLYIGLMMSGCMLNMRIEAVSILFVLVFWLNSWKLIHKACFYDFNRYF